MSERLIDLKQNGKPQPWKMNKLSSLLVSVAFQQLGYEKYAKRVSECAEYVLFKTLKDGTKKFSKAFFCKVRLCPMCSWRRSRLTSTTASKVVAEMQTRFPTYRLVFLTLTVPNVTGENLNQSIDDLMAAWKKLMKRRKIDRVIKGGFRQLEITRNRIPKSNNYGTYHPHFHALLVVDETYFSDKSQYIDQKEWLKYWQESTQNPKIKILDIRVVKPEKMDSEAFKEVLKEDAKRVFETGKAVREVTKYLTDYKWLKKTSVKEQEKMVRNLLDPKYKKDFEWIKSTLGTLQKAIHGRRLQTWFGILRDIKLELDLKDGEEADNQDMITTGEDPANDADVVEQVVYKWSYETFDYFKKGRL